jgi:zinc/manganese transport system substrate-binding protein
MRQLILLVTLLLAAHAAPAAADVKVVATVPDLAAIAREVGGDQVSISAMSLPTQDPHFVDAKPSLVLKLNKADVLLAVGVQLEAGWLPALQNQARNARILSSGAGYLECAAHVTLKDRPTGSVDRSMGDVHPGGNPHFLYDPRAAADCARAIADLFAKVDGKNARVYRANLDRFLAALATARARWEKQLAGARGVPVVSYHRSLTYLVEWIGLDEIATLEPKPGVPPTARHVASVIKDGKQRGVKLVLQEAFYPDKTCTLVAKKLGATVVRIPGGADIGKGQGYIAHMDEVVARIAGALTGAVK